MKVVKHWSGLPREVGGASSLETFKVRLEGPLSNLIWLKMSLLILGHLDYVTFKSRFQPRLSYDSTLMPIKNFASSLPCISVPFSVKYNECFLSQRAGDACEVLR